MTALRADFEGKGGAGEAGAALWSRTARSGYLAGVLACGIITLAGQAVHPHLDLANLVLVYLLGVMFIARRFGLPASALTSVLSVLALDYFFVPPVFSLITTRIEDAITLIIMLGVALFVSGQTAQLRHEAAVARQGERRSAVLYALSSQLAEAQGAQDVARIAVVQMGEVFAAQVAMFFADADGALQPCDGQALPGWYGDADRHAAQTVYDHGRPAVPAMTQPAALHFLLRVGMSRYGVMVLRLNSPDIQLSEAQCRLLDIFVGQVAQTLARIRLVHETEAATARAETESLRNSLLSTIAHDLRTPLASIVAASSSMVADRPLLSEQDMAELSNSIYEESQRMARLLSKVLDMARLEAGVVRLQLDWYALDEIIGSVLSRLATLLQGRDVTLPLAEDLPMVRVDAVLLGQVLENLIENAVKYTRFGSPIEIGAQLQAAELQLWVADRGRGIPAGFEGRIFEKFYRGSDSGLRGGAGLGLTICRALVEAHGGRITAENRSGGGAVFMMHLPAAQTPPARAVEEAGLP